MGLSAQPDGLGSWLVGGAIKGMLSTITSWVDEGAAEALRLTAGLLATTTQPALLSDWFSATYWRLAGLSALLTVPFLFAAAIHALVRSDIALLGRAAFGYLPLAMIGIALAAPLTTLLLSATDEMCAVIAGASGHGDSGFLARAAADIASPAVGHQDLFVAFVVGLLTVAATLALWVELLIRAAAVEVVVLMLPLFFAAMVWPARRIWATRAIETLIALILAKFAIVAVLSLGGAALSSVAQGGAAGLAALCDGGTLILLAVFAPWALLRILPLHELAAATAGGLSQPLHQMLRSARPRGGGQDASDTEPSEPSVDDLGVAPVADSQLDWLRTARTIAARPAATGLTHLGVGGTSEDEAEDESSAERSSARPPERTGIATETAAGLAAVAAAGSQTVVDRAWAPPTIGVGATPDDDRPPINDAFRPGKWTGFVIGEEGDEVMEPPRFAIESDPAPAPAPAPEPDPDGLERA